MTFKVLGSLEVTNNGRACTPSAPKTCRVLALLLLQANRVVGMDTLMEELWGAELPHSATTTTQTYIYQLRKLFAKESLTTPGGAELLTTRAPGYILRVPDDQVDANVFEELTSQGRALLSDGHPEKAAEILREALGLWRGPALADIPAGPVLEGYVAHLEERRIQALELRIGADIRLGRHRELIPELRALVAAYPLHEWFHAQLIATLNRCGRRGEALQAYQHVRHVLGDELGLDPSPELQRLQQEVLTNGVRPAAPRAQLR